LNDSQSTGIHTINPNKADWNAGSAKKGKAIDFNTGNLVQKKIG
jgi:hypothetical protein